MYIEDVAEFAWVLLTTTETTFGCGWQRIQLLFYIQLAAITASRLGALYTCAIRTWDSSLSETPKEDGRTCSLFETGIHEAIPGGKGSVRISGSIRRYSTLTEKK